MRVDVDGLRVKYGEHVVLDGVSLAIESGEVVAVVGPSGSGKTTLLGCIGDLVKPTEGEVRRTTASSDGRVAWILQTASVLPRRSVLDNVALGAYSTTQDTRYAFREGLIALGAVGLADRAGSEARYLSGGERQRAVVARVLVSKPDLVLADEPTAQLDRRNADDVAVSLIDNCPAGTTLVVATHDEHIAARCQRVLEVRNGKVFE